MTIYPPRNLPPEAQQWGRTVENRQRSLNLSQTQTRNSLDNFNRATSSLLAVNSRSLEELTVRQQTPLSFSDMLQTVSVPPSGSTPVVVDNSITVSSPDGELRKALLLISGVFYQNPETGVLSNLGFQLLTGSSVLRRSGFAPVAVSAPAGWTETFSASLHVEVGTDTTMTSQVRGNAFSASASTEVVTVGVTNISASVIFGERV